MNRFDPPKIRLLLVEDNPADAELLKELIPLSQCPAWQIDWVKRLSEAKQRLEAAPFEVILSDLHLPDAKELETITHLKAIAPEIPIVVLTSIDDSELALEAVHQGAQDYLVKGQISYALLERSLRYAIERCQTQVLLRQSEERFRVTLSNSPVTTFTQDTQLRYTWIYNPTHGYSAHEIIGKRDQDLFRAEDAQQLTAIKQQVLSTGKSARQEVALTRSHTVYFYDLTIEPLQQSTGELIGVTGVATDISDRKRAEAQIQTSLHEKEVLLKEIHHRVKNNLQVISAMLSLQAEYLHDPKVIGILKDCENRLQAMTLIHETLYQSEDLGQIDFSDYIQRLANSIVMAHNTRVGDLQLIYELEPILLNLETAIPCGLLLNELVTNAVKHAFINKPSGEILITLKSMPRSPAGSTLANSLLQYQLSVQDNGVGFPAFEIQNLQSFGLKIAYDLALQLQGSLHLRQHSGTKFELIFSELKYRKRY